MIETDEWDGLPEASSKSRAIALAMAAVPPLGVFGGHRFYAGKIGTGFLMLLTAGGGGLWWLYDLVLVAFGSFRDADGRRISRWTEGESEHAHEKLPGRTAQEIFDELYALRSEVEELGERVDFTERLLSDPRKKSG